jgi:hypothetical protein
MAGWIAAGAVLVLMGILLAILVGTFQESRSSRQSPARLSTADDVLGFDAQASRQGGEEGLSHTSSDDSDGITYEKLFGPRGAKDEAPDDVSGLP